MNFDVKEAPVEVKKFNPIFGNAIRMTKKSFDIVSNKFAKLAEKTSVVVEKVYEDKKEKALLKIIDNSVYDIIDLVTSNSFVGSYNSSHKVKIGESRVGNIKNWFKDVLDYGQSLIKENEPEEVEKTVEKEDNSTLNEEPINVKPIEDESVENAFKAAQEVEEPELDFSFMEKINDDINNSVIPEENTTEESQGLEEDDIMFAINPESDSKDAEVPNFSFLNADDDEKFQEKPSKDENTEEVGDDLNIPHFGPSHQAKLDEENISLRVDEGAEIAPEREEVVEEKSVVDENNAPVEEQTVSENGEPKEQKIEEEKKPEKLSIREKYLEVLRAANEAKKLRDSAAEAKQEAAKQNADVTERLKTTVEELEKSINSIQGDIENINDQTQAINDEKDQLQKDTEQKERDLAELTEVIMGNDVFSDEDKPSKSR